MLQLSDDIGGGRGGGRGLQYGACLHLEHSAIAGRRTVFAAEVCAIGLGLAPTRCAANPKAVTVAGVATSLRRRLYLKERHIQAHLKGMNPPGLEAQESQHGDKYELTNPPNA